MIARTARRRVRQGGPLSKGRPALPLAAWRVRVAELRARAGGRCEVCRVRPGTQPHHVRKRSAGGADDLGNLAWLCAPCHRRTDAPYTDGRLVFARAARGGFIWHVLRGADKWQAHPTGETGEIAALVDNPATPLTRESNRPSG